MKTRLLKHSDIKYASLYEHPNADGTPPRQVLVLRLSNDLDLRFPVDGGKATISGFLHWDTDNKKYIDGPVTIVDGVGL